ncbi:MAG TPA: hypothetical protein VF835_03610 [Rhizomicrobium sp.]
MTDKTQPRDMRDAHRTDESRAAEEKAGNAPFDSEGKGPEDAPAEDPHSTIKQ